MKADLSVTVFYEVTAPQPCSTDVHLQLCFLLLRVLNVHLSPIHTFPAQVGAGWEWSGDLAGQGHIGTSGEWPSRAGWDCKGEKKTCEWGDGKMGPSVLLWLAGFLFFMANFFSSHLSSPPALSCSVHVFLGTATGTGTGQNGWNGLWEASLLWCFQVFFQVSQTESCCSFWFHSAVHVLWHWNQAAHGCLHLPVVSNSAVLWNLLSILSFGSSDAMTRWQCYQQLHTFFPNLDSENLNLEETRNKEAGKAMVTLPHVYPWSRVRHAALSLKRTWRKAMTSFRKVKQHLRIRQQKDPKLLSAAELRRTDPEERRTFSSPSLKRKNECKSGTELRQKNNLQAALLEAPGSQPWSTSAWDMEIKS